MLPALANAPGTINEREDQTSMILLATDGTAQTDQAVELARMVAPRTKSAVRVLTVVDQLPVPWGELDTGIAVEYERGLKTEALVSAKQQMNQFGDPIWPIEVEAGDPATKITANAKRSGVKLVMVGLGGHGGTSRVFGSETALRLARVSETPVLAVAQNCNSLPRRILVAMDFSDASIEAARLALELADESASMVLAHVVPWKRTPFVPEEWALTQEASVSAQLSRVIGWLNRQSRFKIGQRILYGRPGPTLLKYAEELDANLIVTGTHGKTAAKRVLGGQTVDKLIRGARCSVLVFPSAAAFHRSNRVEATDRMAFQDAG